MHYWQTLLLLALAALSVSAVAAEERAWTDVGYFVPSKRGSDRVIVFLHGLTGDETTWRDKNETKGWPELLASQADFAGSDIFVTLYRTKLFEQSKTPAEIADQLAVQFRINGVAGYKELIFIAHSMGGIILRSYLLKNPAVAEKTKLLYFVATPTGGASVAELAVRAALAARHGQINKLVPISPDNELGADARAWLSSDLHRRIPSFCAYETKLFGVFAVVDIGSAGLLCNRGLHPVNADHFDIASPNPSAPLPRSTYNAFTAAYLEQQCPRPRGEALLTACDKGTVAVVDALLRETPSCINYQSNIGASCLYNAAAACKIGIVDRVLGQPGRDIDLFIHPDSYRLEGNYERGWYAGWTALTAAEEGKTEACRTIAGTLNALKVRHSRIYPPSHPGDRPRTR